MQQQVGSPTRRLQGGHDIDVAVAHSGKPGDRVSTQRAQPHRKKAKETPQQRLQKGERRPWTSLSSAQPKSGQMLSPELLHTMELPKGKGTCITLHSKPPSPAAKRHRTTTSHSTSSHDRCHRRRHPGTATPASLPRTDHGGLSTEHLMCTLQPALVRTRCRTPARATTPAPPPTSSISLKRPPAAAEVDALASPGAASLARIYPDLARPRQAISTPHWSELTAPPCSRRRRRDAASTSSLDISLVKLAAVKWLTSQSFAFRGHDEPIRRT
jgi:hypothetical protein